jgi:hypothetical protein
MNEDVAIEHCPVLLSFRKKRKVSPSNYAPVKAAEMVRDEFHHLVGDARYAKYQELQKELFTRISVSLSHDLTMSALE